MQTRLRVQGLGFRVKGSYGGLREDYSRNSQMRGLLLQYRVSGFGRGRGLGLRSQGFDEFWL